MLMACHALVADNPHPTEEQVRDAISSNICRCTGYQQIVDAVMHATKPENN
jgi:carbon-monoxide dehydrogenase small subunit